MIKYKQKQRYVIDYTDVNGDYVIILERECVVDHGGADELFSMMQRIQRNDLDRGILSLFTVRTRSIYRDIPDV